MNQTDNSACRQPMARAGGDETRHDVIVVAASAGGLEALKRLVRALPADLPAAVFVLLHVSAGAPSLLPRILARAGSLPTMAVEDGAPIQPGQIYVAPPDGRHVALDTDTAYLVPGPKEHHVRPAGDVLFVSAARAFGPRLVGVVLSGTGRDGAAGLRAIKERGGITIVQDPREAIFAGMPQHAIGADHIDYVLPVDEIGPLLVSLARGDDPSARDGPDKGHEPSLRAPADPAHGDSTCAT